MAQVQAAPSPHMGTDKPVASKEKDGLVAELDELLERYLHTLNEYDKVRKELSKQLSSVTTPSSYLVFIMPLIFS
jgi:hypothetical protein